ncbi:protein-glutamine gamma-glutamyltransferase 4 [Rhinophrynus dorsalis]
MKHLNELLVKLAQLESKHKCRLDVAVRKELTALRGEIASRLRADSFKSFQWIQYRYYLQGNKSGKLLARLILKRRLVRHVDTVRGGDGQSKLLYRDIANAFCDFYRDLYNTHLSSPDMSGPRFEDRLSSFLAKYKMPSLSTSILTALESDIATEEIKTALLSMPQHKCPGPGGLPVAYYSKFLPALLPWLTLSFNAMSGSTNFAPQTLEAHITVIHKEGKDPSLCSNYRPISLLSVDLQLFAKVLALRVSPLLPSLIHRDQVGFVHGRQARGNTTKLISLLYRVSRRHLPTILVSVDSEKAFDRVHWSFLFGVLCSLGFGPKMLQRIRAMYITPTARVTPITNGTRQGYPLSPLLYVLALEPLLIAIRTCAEISGIPGVDGEYKVSGFADDILLSLSNPDVSLPAALNLLSVYSSLSGSRINVSKSEILNVNLPETNCLSLKDRYDFRWAQHLITYLGVKFSPHTKDLFKINYLPLLPAMADDLRHWDLPQISWCGRIPEMSLRAIKLDFLKDENASHHHTTEYDNPNLIIRRGQTFILKINFNRELTHKDKVILQFTIGNQPLQSNGTLVHAELSHHEGHKEPFSEPLQYIDHILQTDFSHLGHRNQWSAAICHSNDKEYMVAVNTPANAIVGKYMLSVITGKGIVYIPGDKPIYLICNPWCKDDTVYMPDEAARKEYVQNDTGYIYIGSANKISSRPWNFGQYEVDILDCCMSMLNKSKLKPASRRDPVTLSRKLSAMVNSNDDQGVLIGNWSGEYSDGMCPSIWTGSSAILQKYYKSKTPIKYGQCWVFSGILTTVLRCIGIPARCVTNFQSAHDTEENLKVDMYYNVNGEKLEELNSDSIWNFHVWNDAWMKRPDLPNGYDGWQALDATPQEPSEGVFQCGPCSLTAIKNGDVYLPYDGKFVFAEVNADKIHWMVQDIDDCELPIMLREEKSSIGKFISTKAINKNLREDITSQYKHKEGSAEERKAFQNACSYLLSDACLVYAAPPPPHPQSIKLQFLGDKDLPLGNPIALTISVENESNEARTVDVVASCQLQTYTGKVIANLASIKQTIEVAGKQATTIPLNVAADLYMKFVILMEDELVIKVNAITETKETKNKNNESMEIHFKYPPLIVDMPETTKINEKFYCMFTFKNTLCIPLQKCELHIEGLGLFKLKKIDQGDVEPGGILRAKIVCNPNKTGEKKIVAELISTEIKWISAERMITITN